MKDLSTFLGMSCLIILFAYIIFNESRTHTPPTTMSDDEVAEPQYLMDDSPLPSISFDVPESATFAGEQMPLNLPDVKERLDK